MSLPPPGLGGGAARPGPPPGFGTSNSSGGGPPNNVGGIGGGTRNNNGAASIVKAQIVFLLTTLSDETFDKASKELRDLASSNGPEMYYYLLNRICMVANPHIQGLIQHFQQYKEDPAAPPHNLPTHGSPAMAWRLLVSEAARAARDVALAPQFSNAVLSPMNSTGLPIPSLRLFGLPTQFYFTLAAYTLASTNIFPSSHQFYNHVQSLLYQSYDVTIDELVSRENFWTYQTGPNHPLFSEDLSMQEARTLILALYPRAPPLNGPNSRPPTPTNPTAPHPALLDTYRRAQILSAISVKFSSDAIIAQTLSALSPGGPPRSPGSIPLEHMLFELGELTKEDMAIEEIVKRWWSPWLLEEGDSQAITLEVSRTIWGLCEGLAADRKIHTAVVIHVLVTLPGVVWPEVVAFFDQPATPFASEQAFELVWHLLRHAPQNPAPPIAGLLPATLDSPVWSNLKAVLTVIGRIISTAPTNFPIFEPNPVNPPANPSAFARIVEPPTAQSPGPDLAKDEAHELQGAGVWNSMGLIMVLVAALEQADEDLASDDVIASGRMASSIMEQSLSLAPELLLLGLEKIKTPLSGTSSGYCDRLWAKYLGGLEPPACTSSTLVFHQLWLQNPQRFWDRLLDFYSQDESHIGRVVEIGMELNILDKLLSDENVHLTLDIASLGVEREYIDLEQWLADGVEVKGDDFLQSIFDFVEHKIRVEFDRRLQSIDDKSVQAVSLGPAVYSIFIRVIRNAENLTAEDVSRFKHMRTDILILHPSLLNFFPGSKEEQGFSEKKPAKEITAQVDQLYQEMYAGTTGLDEFIEDLKRRREGDREDREIFAWCLHSIFDEYKFAKNYPARELTMTGILFGGIIDSRLVKDIPAFVATRYVLDACRTNPNEPMHSFGINALSVLRRSLVDFPGLCRSLLEIPSLHEQHPVLINDIVAALTERAELDQQGGVKAAFPALKLPVLVEEGLDEFVEPDPKKKDAIMFIINQIAPSNYEQKSRDLLNIFEDQYSRWFAHYFIDVRVSLEQNRHDLYMNIIELLNSQVLEKHILWETYRKTRDLINADATISSASERTTLKTIALWLGRLTLARNKPIRMRELSVKDLLIQGFDNKRLIVAIPFVCNLLVSCKDSMIFHLPNPWLVAILGLLVELYHFAELRLNLKFEIEVMFSRLEIDMDLVNPSNVLRTHVPPAPPQEDIPNRLQIEYERALGELAGGQRFESQDARLVRVQAAETEAAAQEAQELFYATVNELIARLPEKMVFPAEYPAFQAPSAKRPVHDAIGRAIQDIIQPVVERSVTIAGISTRDLMSKDFATEPDAAKIRHAAHLMVKNLAGNLALVTCKEPLRTAMIVSIRQVLIQNSIPDEMVPDHMLQGFVNDNLDAACSVVKEAAQDKAAKDIEINMQPHFSARRAHRESRSNQPFSDTASIGVLVPQSSLPQKLQVKPGGLLPAQMRVYDDFIEPSRVYSLNGDNGMYRDMDHDKTGYQQELDPHSIAHSPQPPSLSVAAAVERFQAIASDIDQIIASAPARSVTELPVDHELRRQIQNAVVLVGHPAMQDPAGSALSIAQKVVQLLYRSESSLGREVYVLMLQQLCESIRVVNQEVRDWLIYADDKRKLNVPVTVTLVKAGMIAPPELDQRLSQMLLKNPSDPAEVDFATDIVRLIIGGEVQQVTRKDLASTLTCMLKLEETGAASQKVVDFLSSLKRGARRTSAVDNGEYVVLDEKKQAQLKHFFLDWVRTYRNSADIDKAFRSYVGYLHNEGILKGEDISAAFYKLAVEVAVDGDTGQGGQEGSFIGSDSFASLMVRIVTYQYAGDRNGGPDLSRATYYFKKVVNILSFCLVERHMELGDAFDQKPWSRIFTSLLSELAGFQYTHPPLYFSCLRILANAMGFTQPVYAPRFAFGWMSIISHRLFMPRLLTQDIDNSWAEYHKCIMWLLRFAEPFLKASDMNHSSRSIYRGICRIFCVLVHDFPDFLEEYYHSFVTSIPPNCIQLRNIVLSAYPANDAPLPDAHRGLERLLPEMQRFPTVRTDFSEALESGGIKAAIDEHVSTGAPDLQKIVAELRARIAVRSLSAEGPVVTWNRTLLHAAVYYLGTSCIARIAEQRGVVEFDPKAPELAILAHLAMSLDAEGQYYMICVVADQLRYPSAHTYFFISFMLWLFASAARAEQPNAIPERIGRVLLERIIVQRPHPFGLLVCFVELLNDQRYRFWSQPFAQGDDEISTLFMMAHDQINKERAEMLERTEAHRQREILDAQADHDY